MQTEPMELRMNRVIYPPLSALPDLRKKLEPGEQMLLDVFDSCLAPEWEIYIQPYLNGLRPDFVLLNPYLGIGVFEVKDWNLDAMPYFIENGKLLARNRDGVVFRIENPVKKAELYKQEIYNLYCPRVGVTHSHYANHIGFAAITAGTIFPFAPARCVQALMESFLPIQPKGRKYAPLCGREDILAGNITAIFPESKRRKSNFMNEKFADDLRGWLIEPDFAKTQREPLILDKNQEKLATTMPQSRYRRIRGPAGSGKTLVLASRAARLANASKSVLVVTFNITLVHYIRDLVVRGLTDGKFQEQIEFVHFHMWCKRVCYDAGLDKEYDDLIKNSGVGRLQAILDVDIPALTEKALSSPYVEKYDAILSDEGQDLHPYWWQVLRKALAPDGEMLLVADVTQDIYERASSWTDEAMLKAGFRGRWGELDISYRLPPAALEMASRFAGRYLPQTRVNMPKPDTQVNMMSGLYPCAMRWIQCAQEKVQEICCREVISMMKLTGTRNDLANADITFLASQTPTGAGIVAELQKLKIETADTFHKDPYERRRQKMAFRMGREKIKATTLHSFKGWEARLLVVQVEKADDPTDLALIYTGLTRLKRHPKGSWITVVCSAPNLAAFGEIWQDYRVEE